MVRSFALVYAEMAFERASPAEQIAAVSERPGTCGVWQCLSAAPDRTPAEKQAAHPLAVIVMASAS
jgi:hypothetical protein